MAFSLGLLSAAVVAPGRVEARLPHEVGRPSLAAVRVAIHSADPAVLEPWGGFHAARRILLALRQRADLEDIGGTSGAAIGGYSTHHAQHLGPLGLARLRVNHRVVPEPNADNTPLVWLSRVCACGCPLLRTPPECP